MVFEGLFLTTLEYLSVFRSWLQRLGPQATVVSLERGQNMEIHQDHNTRQTGRSGKEANRKPERKDPLTLIVGLVLIHGLLWHLQVILRWLGLQFGPEGPPSVLIWNWLAVVGALGFIFLVERRSLESIGLLRPTVTDILWALVFWIAGFLVTSVVHSLYPPPPSPGLDVMLGLSIPVLLSVVVTASITEEVIYRGYMIERLRDLTGYIWGGAAVSFVLFLIPHVIFFGPMWILYHSYTTLLIYALYLWRRNLWICILLHLLSNMLIMLPALGIAQHN